MVDTTQGKKKVTTFIGHLRLSSLLPRASLELSKRYKLTRKQMYLIYLVLDDDLGEPRMLTDYAMLLNISNSTLTHNIEKLEGRKILRRIRFSNRKATSLQLMSMGQLQAHEIKEYIESHYDEGLVSQLKSSLAS